MMMMIAFLLHRRAAACCFALTWLFLQYVAAATTTGAQTPSAIAPALQKLLDAEVAAHPSLPGEILHVHLPSRGVETTLAAGWADRGAKRPLTPRSVFRIASVTKTFTAASILRLQEEGKLRLRNPISLHIGPDTKALLESGGYDPGVITIEQLLTHTSGLFDYATAPEYQAEALGNPARRWTAMEQIRLAMTLGKPRFGPGQGYHYSDTGYVVLGQIIERLTGAPLASAYRRLLAFERLRLTSTYLETLEPPPGAKDMAHAEFGAVDTALFDPSFDLYGGGGLVSSAEDLARFFRGLFRGQVFRRPATLEAMLTIPPTNQRSAGGPYAMGIARRTIGGNECWGHTGIWGTSAYHCPAIDLTIVRHYGQAQPEEAFVFNRLYDQITDVLGIRKVAAEGGLVRDAGGRCGVHLGHARSSAHPDPGGSGGRAGQGRDSAAGRLFI
jgi:D-alanyl-D-alanine carboxypeptidase